MKTITIIVIALFVLGIAVSIYYNLPEKEVSQVDLKTSLLEDKQKLKLLGIESTPTIDKILELLE